VWNWSVICLELVSYLCGIGQLFVWNWLAICVELVSYLCGIGQLFAQQSISLPLCNAPLLMLLQETKEFRPQSRQGGGKGPSSALSR
jgi:hypothetical protein